MIRKYNLSEYFLKGFVGMLYILKVKKRLISILKFIQIKIRTNLCKKYETFC